MSDLVVIVPSRGRPHVVEDLVTAFAETSTAHTELVIAVDADDPAAQSYEQALHALSGVAHPTCLMVNETSSMVQALNHVATLVANSTTPPQAIGFMGDDHRPRSRGWDARYLETLRSLPGFVYGNDLIQGAALPTQVAISAPVVRALGYMAPETLRHMYVDNWWLAVGQEAGCISYLPDVIIEHVHPITGKVAWDEGYRRVNARAVYDADRQALREHMAANREREILAVRQAVAGVPQ